MIQNSQQQHQHQQQKEHHNQQHELVSLQPSMQVLIKQDHSFDSYINILQSHGVKIHPSVKCGIFALKNGLPYSGLYASQDIYWGSINSQQKCGFANQDNRVVFAQIPVDLLLTCYKAYQLADQPLRAVFLQEQFYRQGHSWQDKILITFLLYNLHYKLSQVWAEICKNFPKQIDIVQFWPQTSLSHLSDQILLKAARNYLQSFKQQFEQFKQIQTRHACLQVPTFTQENYKWVYIHAVSRCFGSYLGSTYFVPFCEFFNHSWGNNGFVCVQQQQYDKIKGNKCQNTQLIEQHKNSQKNKAQLIRNNQQQGWQIESISQSSADSQQYIQQSDYSYSQVSTYKIKWNSKIGFNLKQKQTKQVQKLHKKILSYLTNQLEWKGFGLLYIGQILERTNLVLNQYMAERRKYPKASQEMQSILYHIAGFAREIKKYYRSLGSCYLKKKTKFIQFTQTRQKQQNNKQRLSHSQEQSPLLHAPSLPAYKKFLMLCHTPPSSSGSPSPFFPKNYEIYFQYGRLSNRTLLVRYGFCLQNNKYEHVWMRLPLIKDIGSYPDLFQKVMEMGLPIYWNFKLKPYVLNTQYIIYKRMARWRKQGMPTNSNPKDLSLIFSITSIQLQIQYIESTISFYNQQRANHPMPSIPLTCPQLTYHEYFSLVYKREKRKIIDLQIWLLEKTKLVLQSIIDEKIQIKGNQKLLSVVKSVTIKHFQSKAGVKMAWGYLRTLASNII